MMHRIWCRTSGSLLVRRLASKTQNVGLCLQSQHAYTSAVLRRCLVNTSRPVASHSSKIAPMSSQSNNTQPHQYSYATREGEAQLLVHPDSASAASTLVTLVVEAAHVAIKEHGAFTLVISGGSLPVQLAGITAVHNFPWDKVWVLFLDERNVPHSDPDSNYKLVQESFLRKVPIPPAQVMAIAEHLPVEQAAQAYDDALHALPPSVLPRTTSSPALPILDLILIGLGPDGHVASLFPTKPTLSYAGERWVLPVSDSPKPPPERITMTLPVINAARDVLFVATGTGKADILQRVLEVQEEFGALPAQVVRPTSGKLRWVMDAASAAKLDKAAWEKSKAFPQSQL